MFPSIGFFLGFPFSSLALSCQLPCQDSSLPSLSTGAVLRGKTPLSFIRISCCRFSLPQPRTPTSGYFPFPFQTRAVLRGIPPFPQVSSFFTGSELLSYRIKTLFIGSDFLSSQVACFLCHRIRFPTSQVPSLFIGSDFLTFRFRNLSSQVACFLPHRLRDLQIQGQFLLRQDQTLSQDSFLFRILICVVCSIFRKECYKK